MIGGICCKQGFARISSARELDGVVLKVQVDFFHEVYQPLFVWLHCLYQGLNLFFVQTV